MNPRWGYKPHTPLAGERLRPLGHLTGIREIWWGGTDSNHRSFRGRFTICSLWPLGNPPKICYQQECLVSGMWQGYEDLNLRMPRSKPGALPLGDIPVVTFLRVFSLGKISLYWSRTLYSLSYLTI